MTVIKETVAHAPCNLNKALKTLSCDTSACCIQLHTVVSAQQSSIIKKKKERSERELLVTAFAEKSESSKSDYQQQAQTALLDIVVLSCKTQSEAKWLLGGHANDRRRRVGCSFQAAVMMQAGGMEGSAKGPTCDGCREQHLEVAA